jgi:hypothetical protein
MARLRAGGDERGIGVKNRSKMFMVAIVATIALAGGVALANWVSSGTGSGYAQATSAADVTLGDASAFTTAQLYPGGSGDLKLRVTNPNAYDVYVSNVTGTGAAVTTDSNTTCDAHTGVTFTDTSGLSALVGHGATVTITLSGKVSMSTDSNNACQGEIFAIPVSVSAHS